MSEALDKLRSIGAKKIHEQTHISLKYVEAILYEEFEGMQKVQLMGFISILEREYHVDLSQLRDNAKVYFEMKKQQEKEAIEPEYKKKLLVSERFSKYNKRYLIYLAYFLGVIVIAIAIMVYMERKTDEVAKQLEKEENNTSSININIDTNQTQQLQDKTVLSQEKNQTLSVEQNQTQQEQNISQEQNLTQNNLLVAEKEQKQEQKQEIKQFVIIPEKKVWFGYIELPSYKHHQKTTRKKIVLDPSKEYLLVFGHRFITIDFGDKKQKLHNEKYVRYHYKNGKLTPISKAEFMQLNKGRIW